MVVDTDGVTKMVDKDSLTKIVGGVCGEEEAGGGRREAGGGAGGGAPGIQNQKQEPRTKLWGMNGYGVCGSGNAAAACAAVFLACNMPEMQET